MNTKLKGRDFLTTSDWTLEELEQVLDLSFKFKQERALRIPHTNILPGRELFMIFKDKSTRTRNSTETAMIQLGGHATYLPAEATQISHGDTAKEIGIIFSRYGDGIAIRDDIYLGVGQKYMEDVAKWADVPVINLESDWNHPMQMLADIMTIKEKFNNNIRNRKFVISWAYASSHAKPPAVPQELVMMMPRFGMNVTLAMPEEFKLHPKAMEIAEKNAKDAGVNFEVVNDMDEAFKDADVVYPKSWGAYSYTDDFDEMKKIADKYKDWIADERRMSLAKKNAIYMHCLPADRGKEVTNAVIDGPQSVVYDEAENRLHTVKAVLALTIR